MEPREETVSVGGVDVHVWRGGRGAPLLVLHGAGGNRGFTRWLRQVAERHEVWAPTHPGFGRSGDADWMETVDDLARFYLWFIDGAGLGRPHLLGQSLGGWTAAELAAMNPGAVDRLVLVSPVGLKPEQGEILDLFYYPAQELRAMTVHDPATIPEWDELYGRPPTPAELDIATRNQEMTARLAWKPYMHNPRLARFLPRVSNPALIVWGRQDRIVPVVCGEQYRRLLPNASLSVLEGCGHLPPIEQPDAFARLVLEFLGVPAEPEGATRGAGAGTRAARRKTSASSTGRERGVTSKNASSRGGRPS
jgi:pimeloyl-ACP methyl ester carboxylesterase